MNHTRLWIAATIIAVFVIVGFILSVPHTRDVAETKAPAAASSTPAVTLHDAYKKGVHAVTGSLMAPNACATISTETALQGDPSSSQTIVVAIAMPRDSGVCLQVPTRISFQTTVEAPANLPFVVTVNGAQATTTMI